MIHDNEIKGLPLVVYKDTESNIEALSAVEGMFAFATDTDKLGLYKGAAWMWLDDAGQGGASVDWENVVIVAKSGGDQTTVTAGIAAASAGDVVLVMPGTYTEDIDIDKAVHVIGIAQDKVILQASTGICVTSTALAILENVTLYYNGAANLAVGFNSGAGGGGTILRNVAYDITTSGTFGAGFNAAAAVETTFIGCRGIAAVGVLGVGVNMNFAGATFNVIGGTFAGGQDYDIQRAVNGTLNLANAHYDSVNGAITYNDYRGTGEVAMATSQAQSFGANGIAANVIAEGTAGAGVTIDGVLLKDDQIGLNQASPDTWLEITPAANGEGIHIGNGFVGQGYYGVNYVHVSHWDYRNTINCYALMQHSNGDTYVNAQTGQTLRLLINNASVIDIVAGKATVTGDVNVSSGIFVGGTGESVLTGQVIIDQGYLDHHTIDVRSDDVDHGMTDYVDTNTYFSVTKANNVAGGAAIRGWKDAQGSGGYALFFQGFLGENGDTTKSTAAAGIVCASAGIKSGTGVGVCNAGANLFTVRNYALAVMIVDAEGDIHLDAGGGYGNSVISGSTVSGYNTYDEYDDIVLLNGLRASLAPEGHELRERFGEWIDYARPVLEKAGIIHYNDGPGEDGRPFVAMRELQFLQIDAMRQMHLRMKRYEAILIEHGLGTKLLSGPSGNN